MQIWLLTIFLILILEIDLVEWKYSKLTIKDFHKNIQKDSTHEINIIIMVNTFRCINCKEILFHKLKKLKEENIIIENNIGLALTFATTEEEYCEYKGSFIEKEKEVYLYLFTHEDRKIKFKEFNNYLYKDNLYDKTLEFVKSYLWIIKEINSLEEFNNEYNSEKLIFVYLGGDNLNYEKYMYFIRTEITHHLPISFNEHSFYFSFNKKLRKKILKQFKYKDNKKDIIGVFRHDSLFNKYDHENLIVLSNFSSKYVLYRYLRNLQFDKVRTCKYMIAIKNLYTGLIRERLSAVVYINSKDEITELRKEFEKVLHLIPKIIPLVSFINSKDTQIFNNAVFKIAEVKGENLYFFKGGYHNMPVKYNLKKPTVKTIIEFIKKNHKKSSKEIQSKEKQYNGKDIKDGNHYDYDNFIFK